MGYFLTHTAYSQQTAPFYFWNIIIKPCSIFIIF